MTNSSIAISNDQVQDYIVRKLSSEKWSGDLFEFLYSEDTSLFVETLGRISAEHPKYSSNTDSFSSYIKLVSTNSDARMALNYLIRQEIISRFLRENDYTGVTSNMVDLLNAHDLWLLIGVSTRRCFKSKKTNVLTTKDVIGAIAEKQTSSQIHAHEQCVLNFNLLEAKITKRPELCLFLHKNISANHSPKVIKKDLSRVQRRVKKYMNIKQLSIPHNNHVYLDKKRHKVPEDFITALRKIYFP